MALNVGELYASFGIDSKGLDKQLSGIEKQCQNMARNLTVAGGVLSAAVTAPIVKMGKSIYEAGTSFEAQMSKVEAISGASGDALDALTQKALEMGSTTQFTATEAGQALEYMAMAGWKDESMLSGLEPIMNLAAASGNDLASTSDIVTDAMTAMGYTLSSVGGDTDAFNKQVTHFSDVLAAASTSANTNVAMMGESFKYVAPLAGSMGYSIDDLAIALGTMANAGIKGSQAGTTLRQLLQNMIKPTKAQSKAMKRLGLDYKDANGNIKPFSELMGDMRKVAKESGIDIQGLQKAVGELDTQLANGEITQKEYDKQVKKLTKGNAQFLADVTELAGARGLSGMLAIMNATDEEFDALTESILHCDGATAKMAQTMLDNAKGDVTIFKSAIEGLSITLWTLVAGPFREVVQGATKVVDAFRNASKSTQIGALKMAGLAAAAGPAMLAVGRVVKFMGRLVPVLEALVSPLGIVTAGLGLFAVAAVDSTNDVGRLFQRMATKTAKSLRAFNSNVTEAMQNISNRMPNLTFSIREGLHALIPAAMETITLVVQGLADAISDNAQNITQIGVTIIQDIIGGFASAAPTLIPSIAGMVANIGVALIGVLPKLVAAAGDLGLSIVQGILDTDWLDLGTKVVTAIGDAIADATTEAITIGTKIATLINDNLTPENLAAMLTNATAFAKQLFATITDSFSTVGEGGVNLVDTLVSAVSGVLEGVTGADFTGKLGKFAEAVIGGVVNSIVTLGTAGSDLLGSVIGGIATMLGNIKPSDFDNLNNVAEAIMTAIGDGISGIGDNAKNIVTNLGTAIGSLLSTITSEDFIAGAGKLATTVIEGLGTAIGKSFENAGKIVDAISNLISGALESGRIGNILENLGNFGATIIAAIAKAIGSAANGAASLITAIGDLISGALSGSENGESMIGDLSSFGQTIITALIEAVKSVANSGTQILTAIGDAIAGVKWADVGTDLGALAVDLIDSLISSLSDEASGVNFTGIMEAIGSGLGESVSALMTVAGSIVSSLVDYIITDGGWQKLGTALLTIFTGITSGIDVMMQKIIDKVHEFDSTTENLGEFVQQYQAKDFETGQMTISIPTVFKMADKYGRDQVEIAQYLKDLGFLDSFEVDAEGGVVNYKISDLVFSEEDQAYLMQQLQKSIDDFNKKVEERDESTITEEMPVNVEYVEGTYTFTYNVQEAAEQALENEQSEVTAETSVDTSVTVGSVSVGNETGLQTATQTAVDTLIAAQKFTSDVSVTANVNVIVGDNNAAEIGTQLGSDLGDSFVKAISAAASSAGAAAAGLVASAVRYLGTGSSAAYTSGANFGRGFINGMDSMLSAVASKASQMAARAVSALKAGIREGSPSKITFASGEFFGEGFVNGIASQVRAVSKESSKMANAAVDALTVRSNSAPALAVSSSQRNLLAVDYDRLADAMSNRPEYMTLNGKVFARLQATQAEKESNAYNKSIALGYGK